MREIPFGILMAACAGGIAHAAPSYTFGQPTGCGAVGYPDSSGQELTDGVLGKAGWALNQGLEWVGWKDTPVFSRS